MSEESTTALTVIEERIIVFHDEITFVLVENPDGSRQWYVALRPICKYLRLSWSGQFERIDRDPVLREEARLIRIRRTAQGGNPETLCLPLDYLTEMSMRPSLFLRFGMALTYIQSPRQRRKPNLGRRFQRTRL